MWSSKSEGKGDEGEWETTYAGGQMLVKMNNGILCREMRGLDGPKVDVIDKATSREIYVVAAKNAMLKNV